MQLRPAQETETDLLARLIVGDEAQSTTVAGMRLFALDDVEDALELNRVMIESTGGWRSMVVAAIDGPVGLVQIGEAFLALTPEVVAFAQRLYGDDFQQVLGPRLEAMGRVQTTYPPDCLQISEIHVAPDHRGEGIGSALMGHAIERAAAGGLGLMGLQTLTNNPARAAFEAWGFEVAETVTDPDFEALTGAPGYYLMLREV